MSEDNKANFDEIVRKVLEMVTNAFPLQVKITGETFNLQKGEYEDQPESIGGMGVIRDYYPSAEEKKLSNLLDSLVAEGFIKAGEQDHYVATLQSLKRHNLVSNVSSE